jgi:anionic cell wall polymer biosynthesis LytR-Cps2A-Psr (LCP) family protein
VASSSVVAEATRSGGVEFAEGSNRLDGAEMLAFLRQTDLPGGEADRAQRQQAVVRALSRQVIEQVPDRGPIAAYDLFDTASSALTVDDTLTNYNLRALGVELRNVRPATTSFLFAPVAGAAEGGVLSLDDARATQLWDALRTDSVDSYSARFPDDVLGTEVP